MPGPHYFNVFYGNEYHGQVLARTHVTAWLLAWLYAPMNRWSIKVYEVA